MRPDFFRAISRILLGISIAVASGCATAPVPPEEPPYEQIDQLTAHQQKLAHIKSWKLKGRLVISYNGNSWNASIHWQKSPERYDIQLYLPLGQGSMQLKGDADGATLKTSDGEHFMAENSENLFYQQFGLVFPITALQEWIIGRPASGADSSGDWLQRVDENGRMVSLKQNRWNMRLLNYKTVLPGGTNTAHDTPSELSLPRKIFLTQNGNSVRLVVQQWQLDD